MGNTFWTPDEIANWVLGIGITLCFFVLLFLAFLLNINLSGPAHSLFLLATAAVAGVWIIVGARILKCLRVREEIPFS